MTLPAVYAARRDGACWGRRMARAEFAGSALAYAVWWRSETALAQIAPQHRRTWQAAFSRGHARSRRAIYRAAVQP